MNRRRWLSGGILLAALAGGAIREFLFINLNYQIDHVARATPFSYAHSAFQRGVEGWDLGALLRMKWVLAVFFVLFMWALCQLIIRLLEGGRRLARTTTWIFGGVAATALFFHLLARLLPGMEEASVNLLHAVQYPIGPFLLWAVLLLFPRPEAQAR